MKIAMLARTCSSVVLFKVCLYLLLYHYTIGNDCIYSIVFVTPGF